MNTIMLIFFLNFSQNSCLFALDVNIANERCAFLFNVEQLEIHIYSINMVKNSPVSYLDGLVCSCDKSNEEWQHHVNEEGDEGVQVNLAEQPHQSAALLHLWECYEHVVSINEREEALRYHGQRTKLRVRKQLNQTSAYVKKWGWTEVKT